MSSFVFLRVYYFNNIFKEAVLIFSIVFYYAFLLSSVVFPFFFFVTFKTLSIVCNILIKMGTGVIFFVFILLRPCWILDLCVYIFHEDWKILTIISLIFPHIPSLHPHALSGLLLLGLQLYICFTTWYCPIGSLFFFLFQFK